MAAAGPKSPRATSHPESDPPAPSSFQRRVLPVPGTSTAEPAAPDLVVRARAYIEAHWAENVSLDQLARVSHVSKFHLARAFRRAVGLPPHAYQRRLRLARAMQMLAGGMPVSHVAYATGFSDQAHLTRALKRDHGVTPARYARAHREAA